MMSFLVLIAISAVPASAPQIADAPATEQQCIDSVPMSLRSAANVSRTECELIAKARLEKDRTRGGQSAEIRVFATRPKTAGGDLLGSGANAATLVEQLIRLQI